MIKMRMIDIIEKKRDGLRLTGEEIQFFINGYIKGVIPDYQASALLMAIYFQKMDARETFDITQAVIQSGQRLDLSAVTGIKVDKHSTGGVGDKTTIVLLPLVAAAGAKIAKLTGKGMGHTGGTMDKFMAFKGINLALSSEQFVNQINKIGVALQGQTKEMVPADKQLYALRDVTGTIPNTSLIACSIMSKKIASGADAIVLDVKVGRGAFMTDIEKARTLAHQMVKLGKDMGRDTIAVLSQMDEPLGHAVGNILEVQEAIQVLKGQGPSDVLELCLTLGSHMLVMAKICQNRDDAKNRLLEQIANGKAIEKLKELVTMQGGDPAPIDDDRLFKRAANQIELLSEKDGYVATLDARLTGQASMMLGAGRITKESPIDLTAGILIHAKVGDWVAKGSSLATLYTSDDMLLLDSARQRLQEAYVIKSKAPRQALSIILDQIQ